MVTLCAKLRQRLRRVFVDKGRTGEDCCSSVGGSENLREGGTLLLFQGVDRQRSKKVPNESLNPPGLDFWSLVELLKKNMKYYLFSITINFNSERGGGVVSRLPFLFPVVPTALCYVLCKPLLTFLSSQFASQAFRFTRYVPHYKCVSSLEGEFYWKTFWPPF